MVATAQPAVAGELDQYRRELTGYCYRMLGSAFDAEDAVQETMLRAWRSVDRFEGRSALRSWLYRIATNVCFDQLNGRERRARPMDLGPAQEPLFENLAELLETSVASVNSALQRARATLATADIAAPAELDDDARTLLERYVVAFEAYDIDRLTELLHEDAIQSMPPYSLWLQGREDIFTWWFGVGIGCKGSKLVPVGLANGMPAWGQFKPDPDGGHAPWALIVPEVSDGRIVELTFFLDTQRLFPLFGLPDRLA